MQPSFFEGLSCSIVPGTFAHGDPVPEIYNHLYRYWKPTWTNFFDKAGMPAGTLNIENFLRHTYTIIVHRDSTIIGSLSSSAFNLNALVSYDHASIKIFEENIPNKRGQALTGEYLSVNPEFKKTLLGMSMADVLIGIVLKIFVHVDAQVMLATTVRKAKVDVVCREYGLTEVGSYLKSGVDCVKLFTTQENLKAHPDSHVNELTERLWAQRQDFTGKLGEVATVIPLRRAA